MTIGSLFSGIGGLDLGLEMCGLGPVLWQCDSDPCARAVLAEHWPGVKRYEDVRQVDERAARPDIICGGFPCQPVSQAGKKLAQRDPRWLWPFFAAVVARIRPAVVFIENVPGLLAAGMRDVLSDLAGMGFDAEWGCFSAAEAGAPHLRERLFILAYADSIGREEVGILGLPELGSGTWAAQRRDPYRCGGEDARFPSCREHVDQWYGPQPAVRAGAHGLPARMAHRLGGNACIPAQAALAFRTLAARTARGSSKEGA